MEELPTLWYIYTADKLLTGCAHSWTKLLNEALRGPTRLSNSLVWNWLNWEGRRSDGKTVCSDLMVSSVVKRLWRSPGVLWMYLVWTLQGFQTIWNQRDKQHFSCCSCLHTLVGSLAEVSGFLVSKWSHLKQFLLLCSWRFHRDYRIFRNCAEWCLPRACSFFCTRWYFWLIRHLCLGQLPEWPVGTKRYCLLTVYCTSHCCRASWDLSERGGQGDDAAFWPQMDGRCENWDDTWTNIMPVTQWWRGLNKRSLHLIPFQGCQIMCNRGPCVWTWCLTPKLVIITDVIISCSYGELTSQVTG